MYVTQRKLTTGFFINGSQYNINKIYFILFECQYVGHFNLQTVSFCLGTQLSFCQYLIKQICHQSDNDLFS